MSVVFEAQQATPNRRVAVKFLNATSLGTRAAARLRHETDLVAQLDHPSIAQVYEFGSTEDGAGTPCPYFVMELVSNGVPITKWAASRSLSLDDRVGLLEQAAAAVAHAHRRGVIHRDLKPANILVDELGHVKVIDFGIAAREGAGTASQLSSWIGTPEYLPPECALPSITADTRSDIYSLGLTSLEVLTQIRPGASESERLAAMQQLPATLRAVIDKSMSLSPDDRYNSGHDLLQDLRAWRTGAPLLALRNSLRHQISARVRAVARTRSAPLLGAIAGIAILLAIVFASQSAARKAAVRQRDHAAALGRASLATRIGDAEMLESAANEFLPGQAHWEHRVLRRLLRSPINQVSMSPGTTSMCLRPDGSELMLGDADGTLSVWRRGEPHPEPIGKFDRPVMRIEFSTDGDAAIISLTDNIFSLVAGNRVVRSWLADAATFGSDGKVVLACVEGTISTFDTHSGELLSELRWTDRASIDAVQESPDGRFIAMTGTESLIFRISLIDGDARRQLHGFGKILDFDWLADGSCIFLSSSNSPTTARDGFTTPLPAALRLSAATDVDAAEKAARFVLGVADGRVVVVDSGSMSPIIDRQLHSGPVRHVSISRDGETIASLGADGRLVWTTASSRPDLRGQVTSVQASHASWLDETTGFIFSVSEHGSGLAFDVSTMSPAAQWRVPTYWPTAVAYEPSTNSVATGCMNGDVWITDLEQGATYRYRGDGSAIAELCVNPRGGLVALSNSGQLRFISTRGELMFTAEIAKTGASAHRASDRLIVADDRIFALIDGPDVVVAVWDLRTNQATAVIRREALSELLQRPASSIVAMSVLEGGRSLVLAESHSLHRVDLEGALPSTARMRWSTGGVATCALKSLPSEQRILAFSRSGDLTSLDLDGNRVFSMPTVDGPIVFAGTRRDGSIVVQGFRRPQTLVYINLSEPTAASGPTPSSDPTSVAAVGGALPGSARRPE